MGTPLLRLVQQRMFLVQPVKLRLLFSGFNCESACQRLFQIRCLNLHGPKSDQYSIIARGSTTREAALSVGPCAGLLAFYADHQVVTLPPDHRFPINKYRDTRMLLEEDLLLRDILVTHPAPDASQEELSLAHDKRYIQKVRTGDLSVEEQRTMGFPWSPELAKRSSVSCGGTIAAMHAVMLGVTRAAANIAGGTHHAFRDHGEGFCTKAY